MYFLNMMHTFLIKMRTKKEAADLVKEIWTENYGYQYDYFKNDYKMLFKARIEFLIKLVDCYQDFKNLKLRIDAIKVQAAIISIHNTDYFNKIPDELKLFSSTN